MPKRWKDVSTVTGREATYTHRWYHSDRGSGVLPWLLDRNIFREKTFLDALKMSPDVAMALAPKRLLLVRRPPRFRLLPSSRKYPSMSPLPRLMFHA
jgi:hypothetical protein